MLSARYINNKIREFRSKPEFFLSSSSAVFTAVTLAVAYTVATLYVPRLIEAAYRGESSPFFNGLIHARSATPLSVYLDHWRATQNFLLAAFAMAGGLFTLLVFPPFQSCVDRCMGSGCGGVRRLPLSVRIPAVVGISIAVIQGSEIFLDREWWPFLNYSMYSAPQPARVYRNRVYGVAEGREFPLYASLYIPPFSEVDIHSTLDSVLRDGDQARMDAILSGCYKLYLDARRQGRHHGPNLQALRIYRITWNVENKPSENQVDDLREKIYEFRVRS